MSRALIRALDPVKDYAITAGLFARATDYAMLESGLPPDAATLADFFTGDHPDIDHTKSLRLGLFQGPTLAIIAEMAFGYPNPGDAFIGLLLAAPEYRNLGLGHELLDHLAAEARARLCPRLLIAVLDANAGGKRFWLRQGFVVIFTTEPIPRGLKTHVFHRMARPLPPL